MTSEEKEQLKRLLKKFIDEQETEPIVEGYDYTGFRTTDRFHHLLKEIGYDLYAIQQGIMGTFLLFRPKE